MRQAHSIFVKRIAAALHIASYDTMWIPVVQQVGHSMAMLLLLFA